MKLKRMTDTELRYMVKALSKSGYSERPARDALAYRRALRKVELLIDHAWRAVSAGSVAEKAIGKAIDTIASALSRRSKA